MPNTGRGRGPFNPPRGAAGGGEPRAPESGASGGSGAGLTRLPLASNVARLVREQPAVAVHPGLVVTRLVRWAEHENEPRRWDFKVRDPKSRGEKDRKRDNLDIAVAAARNASVTGLAREWLNRRQAWLAATEKLGLSHRFRASTEWRLAIGLASAGPLETGIRLHHLYGVPVLPGSGLKGLALAAARDWLEVHEREYGAVFGTRDAAGLVDVLDAAPIPRDGRNFLEVDVMNPHYPRWYRGEPSVPPSDDQSPVPVFFLTVPLGTEFEFALLCRRRTDEARHALGRAVEWLRVGLTEMGAGAKTAAGYGYFTEIGP